MRNGVRGSLIILGGCAGLAAAAGAALPPATFTRQYRSGDAVVDIGVVNNPFNAGVYGGPGFFGLSINNSGTAHALASIYGPPVAGPLNQFRSTNHAVLASNLGLLPFLAGYDPTQVFGIPSYQVVVPSTDYMFDQVFWISSNNLGNTATVLGLAPVPGTSVSPVTGVFFNRSAMPVKEGDAVTASGVAPGTVFAAFGPTRTNRYNGSPLTSFVQINDNNALLVATQIIESGQTKNAILLVTLDANGNAVSQALVAKVGGSVGGSGDTWTSLAVTPNTCAINNAGQVIFSGSTSSGVSGIYRTGNGGTGGGFVAVSGGPTPGGSTWGPLVGVPVDINASGSFAFRGIPLSNGTWTEVGDAAEAFSSVSPNNSTLGGGPLLTISGQLGTDHDVDLYYIMVGDPTLQTQVPFTATTVPDPGSGFAGAGFDTVLYLFADNQNCNGNTRVGVGRNDDVSLSVVQSTLTGASLRADHVPGTRYYLGVSTPKARAQARNFDMWQRLPSQLATSGGVVYWSNPGTGQIMRADASTGAMLAPLNVAAPPTQTSGTQPSSPNAPVLDAMIGVYEAGANSRLIFRTRGWAAEKFRVCDLSGGNVQDLTLPSGFSSNGMSSFAIDSVNGRMYWSRPSATQTSIFRASIDGTSAEVAVAPVDPCDCDIYNITAMAVDNFGTGRLYWYESLSNRIVFKSLASMPDLTGAGITQVLTNANVTAMTIDSAARRLYYTSSTGNRIGVIDLTTNTALANLLTTTAPDGIAVSPTLGKVYWSNPIERMLRRSNLSPASIENWLALGGDTGERPSDGPNYLDCASPTFAKTGTAVATPLSYQIRLTGATFARQGAQINKNNTTKVVQVGDVLPAGTVTVVGAPTAPVRLTDRGLVAWTGTAARASVFLGTDMVMDSLTVPTGGGTAFGSPGNAMTSLECSSSGQFMAIAAFNGAFNPPGTAGDSAVVVRFDSVPGCAPDFNNDGSLTVQDIFDFLNAWFAGSASADFNGTGGVSVQDIFDYLNAWFAGC